MGEEEERDEGEEKERVVKTATVPPVNRGKNKFKKKKRSYWFYIISDTALSLYFYLVFAGKRHKRKKKAPAVTVVSADVPEEDKEGPAKRGEWEKKLCLMLKKIMSLIVFFTYICYCGKINKDTSKKKNQVKCFMLKK